MISIASSCSSLFSALCNASVTLPRRDSRELAGALVAARHILLAARFRVCISSSYFSPSYTTSLICDAVDATVPTSTLSSINAAVHNDRTSSFDGTREASLCYALAIHSV